MQLDLAEGGHLYYEVHGERGEWLVLLNGAMSSTVAWAEIAPLLARHHRVLLLDFRDQGQSSQREAGYEVGEQCRDVVALFDHLGIERANVMGISYGGVVAMRLASEHGDRIQRLILASITARPTALLQAASDAWDAIAAQHDGAVFFSACAPLVYSHRFFERRGAWLQERYAALSPMLPPAWFEAYRRIARSARAFDASGALAHIEAPTLLVCGELDQLTPAQQMFRMADHIADCTALAIPGAGHGVFLEQPRAFAAAILGFTSL